MPTSTKVTRHHEGGSGNRVVGEGDPECPDFERLAEEGGKLITIVRYTVE
jgi:hypothetical protein